MLCIMGSMNTHLTWFQRTTDNASGLEASTKAQISTSTLNRQLNKGQISPENVIALSRAYGISPVESLAATGYLTSTEASGMSSDQLARTLSDQALVRELSMRIDANESAWFGMFGELVDEDQGATVSQLHGDVDPAELEGLPYAASDAPDEPGPGDEGYHDGP